MLARAGIIGYYTNKEIKKKNYIHNFHDQIMQDPNRPILYVDKPYGIWTVAFLAFVAGIFLEYFLLFFSSETLFSGFRRGNWWKHLIGWGIIILGIAFLAEGWIEVVEIDRKKDVVLVTKKNIFGSQKVEKRKASDSINARIVRKSINDTKTSSYHYELFLDFEGSRPLKIADTSSRATVKKKYVQVGEYLLLEINLDDIPIDDHTRKSRKADSKKDE